VAGCIALLPGAHHTTATDTDVYRVVATTNEEKSQGFDRSTHLKAPSPSKKEKKKKERKKESA
jgi:hypothetical protein